MSTPFSPAYFSCASRIRHARESSLSTRCMQPAATAAAHDSTPGRLASARRTDYLPPPRSASNLSNSEK